MPRFLVDTNVFLYAHGREHRYREPCNQLLDLIENGQLTVEASVELVHEIAHVWLRKTGSQQESLDLAEGVAEVCVLHSFTTDQLWSALKLVRQIEQIDFRDAVYATTAIDNGIDYILSADRDFDRIPRIRRLDPIEVSAVEALL